MIKNIALYLLLLVSLFSCSNHEKSKSYSCINSGQLDTSDSKISECIRNYYTSDNELDRADQLNNIGKICEEKGDFVTALQALNEAKEIYENINSHKSLITRISSFLHAEEERNGLALASIYTNLSMLYADIYNYKTAIEYAYKASYIDYLCNKDDLIKDYINLGDLYLKDSDLRAAFYYTTLSDSLEKTTPELKAVIKNNLGNIQYFKHNYAIAKVLYEASLSYITDSETSNMDTYCEATLGIARCYNKLNSKDSSIKYATISLTKANIFKLRYRTFEANKFLGENQEILQHPNEPTLSHLSNALTLSEELYKTKIGQFVDLTKEHAEKEKEKQIHSTEEHHLQKEILFVIFLIVVCSLLVLIFRGKYISIKKYGSNLGDAILHLFNPTTGWTILILIFYELLIKSSELFIKSVLSGNKFDNFIASSYQALRKTVFPMKKETIEFASVFLSQFFVQVIIGAFLVHFHHYMLHNIKSNEIIAAVKPRSKRKKHR